MKVLHFISKFYLKISFFSKIQGKGAIQTYWLSGAKEAYIEHANILESKNEIIDNEVLSDYHTTMYEIIDTKKSLSNVINKLPASTGQCPFSGL